jgi:hypothetical protein
MTKKQDWKAAAVCADAATLNEQLRGVAAAWAAARETYVSLWDATHVDDLALRRAVRRFQDIDRLRRSLVERLAVG